MTANTNKKVDVLIRGGRLVTEGGSFQGSVAISKGIIVGFLAPDTQLEAEKVIDADGCVVLPGLIDPHVHLFSPGSLEFREDFYCGTQAAAAGGVTTIITMPLDIPPLIDRESFDSKREAAKSQSVVDFAFWGGLIPKNIQNLSDLHELGCVAFKAFMSYGEDFYPNMPDQFLFEAMKKVASFNGLIGVHAENADIVAHYSKLLKENERVDGEAHSDARPEIAELEAIQRAILFAEYANCRLHICHMSTDKGAETVCSAKKRGVRVTSETCHHYLTLDRSELSLKGNFVKCNPPLRDKETVERLWQYVLKGYVDCIASDHGPFTDEQKQGGGKSIWDAPAGFGGIDAMLPLIIDEGVKKRGLALETLAKITSTNAAKIFGLYPKKGSLLIGGDADITILDLNKEWVYSGKATLSKTKSSNSPFEGRKIRGKVVATLVRGQTVYQEGQILVKPGTGRYISRCI
ncbi:MAG: allantoinase AllB [Bacillota bacterium]|jgi:allantoinase